MLHNNFDDILNDFSKLQSLLVIVAVNIVGHIVSTTGNQVLIFLTYLGSLVYIWLKVKREFFTKKE